ncbi:MAG: hypothetical protein HXS50_03405 [Theionarchaea archaeon]|nr:hypothetical protein [Theionarchaea archaeon]
MKSPGNGIPQVVAIQSVSKKQGVRLKKKVRQYLGITDGNIWIKLEGEVLIGRSGMATTLDESGNLILPSEVIDLLGIGESSIVALVERGGDLAIKLFEIDQIEGEGAELIDIETPYKLIRRSITNPMPEDAIEKTRDKYSDLELRYDPSVYLSGNDALNAWKCRRILGIPEENDDELREKLIAERLGTQLPDGSWDGKTTLTARNLGELADLGLTIEDVPIRKGARWLMDRAESAYNPGMFFATDNLVIEQAEVIERRNKKAKGTRERFNQRRSREVSLVRTGDELIKWPCGPRITWSTALVLESLLKLGLESEKRIQSALWMLKACRWCDNAQQHGISPERQARIDVSRPDIQKMEAAAISFYRYDVQGRERELMNGKFDPVFYLRRIERSHDGDEDQYRLWMPDMGGGCPVIMVRSLSNVRDGVLRKLAEIHLWEFLAWQDPVDGHFRGRDKIFEDPTIFLLDLLSRYDNPLSRFGILRAIPWIVENQNEDGSWGGESYKDRGTLAVLSALDAIAEHLPRNFFPA